MERYLVIEQSPYNERLFKLKSLESGYVYDVDFYTNGEFEPPVGADATPESWKKWLGSFVGKVLELEYIIPSTYFAGGINKIVE